MKDNEMNGLLGLVRDSYHVAPKTPREEMWQAISTGMKDMPTSAVPATVIELGEVRRRRKLAWHPASWAAAAAALVVLGIGIGRTSAPTGTAGSTTAIATTRASALTLAAQEHLGRTESLLTMVRADGRAGVLDPSVAEWARGLLSQTRLFIDARPDGDVALDELFEDLELVLAQIVGVSGAGPADDPRAYEELQLALRSLENGEVLPRIQAALTVGMAGA